MEVIPWTSRVLLLLLCLLLPVGCKASRKQRDRADVQFAFVMEPQAGHAPWNTVHFGKEELPLEAPRRFRIIEARRDVDQFGYPAVWFQVDSAQQEEFKRWTGENVGRRLAILIDGQVATAPRVRSALPGFGIIDFGADHKAEEEVEALAARIVAQG